MLRKIEKPDISTFQSERFGKLFRDEKVQGLVQKSLAPYSHWEKIKHWQIPEGVKAVEVWATIKFIRNKVLDRKESVVEKIIFTCAPIEQHQFWDRVDYFLRVLMHDD